MFQFLWEEKSHRLSASSSPTSFFNTEVEQSLCHTNQTSHHPARNQPRLHTRPSLEQQIHTTWSSPKTKMAYCALYSYSPVTQVFLLQYKNCELCSVSRSPSTLPISDLSSQSYFPQHTFHGHPIYGKNPVTLFISPVCNPQLRAICYFSFRLISLCCLILFLF